MSSFPPPRPCGADCTEAHMQAHGQGQVDGLRQGAIDTLDRLEAWGVAANWIPDRLAAWIADERIRLGVPREP